MAIDQVAAIVSSAICPSVTKISGADVRLIATSARLQQTRESITSLLNLGIENIILVDGSGENWDPTWAAHLAPARVFVQSQDIYTNKGLLEILLLLGAVSEIPPDHKIVKLSGRYTLAKRIDRDLMGRDFVFRKYCRESSLRGVASTRTGMNYPHVSTVAYAVRNREIFRSLLVRCLRELYGYQTRIVGPRSLFRLIKNSIFAHLDEFPYHDPPISIELAMLRALRGQRGTFVDELGVKGISGQNGMPYSE